MKDPFSLNDDNSSDEEEKNKLTQVSLLINYTEDVEKNEYKDGFKRTNQIKLEKKIINSNRYSSNFDSFGK